MSSSLRAERWAALARGDQKLGTVRSRASANGSPRWFIDFGRRWGPRFLYSYRGTRFDTREFAIGVLSHVAIEVAKSRDLADILSEFAPESSGDSDLEMWVGRWIELFEKKVKAGDRQPRTLRDYKRWAGLHAYQSGEVYRTKNDRADHFHWWSGRSIWEIDAIAIEEWSYWLTERMGPKSRWNVMAAFHAFLSCLANRRRGFEIPRFEWPQKGEHLPRIISREIQNQVIEAIPEGQRGIYYAMADCLIRPSEARALPLNAWDGDSQLRVDVAFKERNLKGKIGSRKRLGSGKVLPTTHRLQTWLDSHNPPEHRLQNGNGALFRNPAARNAAGRFSESALETGWKKACAKIGVEVGLYEGTKHCTATYLKSQGVDDRVLAELMGHADIRSVEKYARVQSAMILQALSRLR